MPLSYLPVQRSSQAPGATPRLHVSLSGAMLLRFPGGTSGLLVPPSLPPPAAPGHAGPSCRTCPGAVSLTWSSQQTPDSVLNRVTSGVRVSQVVLGQHEGIEG